jgi:hypothetical protein
MTVVETVAFVGANPEAGEIIPKTGSVQRSAGRYRAAANVAARE